MFSKRLTDIPESGTVAISNLVNQLKQEGKNIISFSMGEPDFDTPGNIKDACIRSLSDGFTRYTPSTGIPELRNAIAEKTVRDNKIKCTAKNVLVTPTKQALFMIMLAYLDPKDEVVISDPAWVSYGPTAINAGAKPVYVPTRFEDNFKISAEMVGSAITKRTKMLILNSPSNPTGSVMDRKTLKDIAELCIEKNIMVLSDEIYEHIIYEGEHVSIASFDGMFDRTITISGLSKTYAMTGWRLGWMVAPEKDIAAVNKLQTHSITCCTSFTQPAGVEALRGPQDSRIKMVGEFRKRRDLALDLLNDIRGVECNRPEGAFYLFPKYDHKISSDDLAMYLMKDAHVAITPGSSFGRAGEGFFRLSYATSEDNIIEGIGSIKRSLSKL